MRSYRKSRLTPDDQISTRFGEFTGLVNTRSRKSIGLKALYAANNVFLTDDSRVVRRFGQTAFFTGDVRGGFVVDGSVYLDDAGTLKRRVSATDIRTIVTGLTGTAYDCAVQNGSGVYVNGVDAGIVRGDTHLPLRITAPQITSVTLLSSSAATTGFNRIGAQYTSATWRFCATYETTDGRESAPSLVVELAGPVTAAVFRVECPTGYAKTHVYCTEPNGTAYRRVGTTTNTQITVAPSLRGRVLTTLNTAALPAGVDKICFCLGRLYAAEYNHITDTTAIWMSLPHSPHLFRKQRDFGQMPGQVTLLLCIDDGSKVLACTTQQIAVIANGRLSVEADYGVPAGQAGDVDAEGKAYFWSVRGFCTALPFKNLTEADVSMAPGTRVACKLVYVDGMMQVIAVTQGGGVPFNLREERS